MTTKDTQEEIARTALDLSTDIDTLSDENLGRLAVLERLSDLMAANNDADNHEHVDFGKVREKEFWTGVYELARVSAHTTEEIRRLAYELYGRRGRTGGA